ncbi:MAG: hypothetical protein GAK37_00100 [Pseudomonas sp.]|nr:MAG: hypothetical protein GAK37_00100 [Pseudomonas sp.]
MTTLRIQYDRTKDLINQHKHRGISLADTEFVFYDEKALTRPDRNHDEPRWVTLGMDANGRLLVVAYTYREPDVVRVISARRATTREQHQYLEA